MKLVLAPFRILWWLVTLIRDGESDVQGTYPEHAKTTGEQAAVHGSLFASMSGVGHP